MNNSDKLKDWYENFITTMREEYSKLTNEEKKYLHISDNYNSPCQVEIFWLKEPNWQLIIKTNFHDRLDKEIIVNGPYDSHIFLEEIEKILNESRWSNSPDPGNHFFSNVSNNDIQTLAQQLHNLVEMAKNSLFIKAPSLQGIFRSQTFGNGGWMMQHFGNIADFDHKDFASKMIQDTKTRVESLQKQKQTEQNNPIFPNHLQQEPKGFGAFFFPPIYVGKIPKPTIRDTLYGGQPYVSPFHNNVFDIKFQKIPIAVSKDGFIVVCNDKKENALKILNTIMATAILENMAAFAVREHELSEVTYNPETFVMTGLTYNLKTVRDMLFYERRDEKIRLGYGRKELDAEFLKKIINDAAIIFDHSQISEELRILLESITHLNDSEFAQAFFMGWVIIERHISQIWYDKIHSKKILDHNRTSKLLNPGMWSIDYLIEVLNMEEDIEEHEYDVYMDLKRKRNDLIHSGKQIRKDDATKCVDVAKAIILKKITKILTSTHS